MEYEVEVTVKRYVDDPYHPFDQPTEIEVYKDSKIVDIEEMREVNGVIWDAIDDMKYPSAEAVVQDVVEENSSLYEARLDEEDMIDNEAKAHIYHEKYGDPL